MNFQLHVSAFYSHLQAEFRRAFIYIYIEGVPGGNVSILGGHSVGHSKQKKLYMYGTCVLFRTVSEIQLFHCTIAKLLIKRYYVLFLILVFIVQVTKVVRFT